jgi:DNA gyrase subunit A
VHVGDVPNAGEQFDVSATVKASEFFGLTTGESLVSVLDLNDPSEIVVGTANGIVKRVVADFPSKPEFEVIALKEGDALIGAARVKTEGRLFFVANDAQTLAFASAGLRAQGRPASGVAGINLVQGAKAIYFGFEPDGASVLITGANSSQALQGTDSGSIKVSPTAEIPSKGRATGGVRGHKFIRNEDQLFFAAVAPEAAIANAVDGKPFDLPELTKRDASGTSTTQIIGGVGIRAAAEN